MPIFVIGITENIDYSMFSFLFGDNIGYTLDFLRVRKKCKGENVM